MDNTTTKKFIEILTFLLNDADKNTLNNNPKRTHITNMLEDLEVIKEDLKASEEITLPKTLQY